ncbi:hypothetical protein [uncultured Phocaeicola sp.]|uniref:hypothetical protein n=1 Tax=uncultured Phocaeicola sp. TaxID=990718 RepID=UPI0025CF7FE9|nr:hypothetical protein [uncultured Phocaeicola sp.]
MKVNVDELKEQALSIVADAMQDEDLPPAKRADMALALLGKAALKEGDQPNEVTDGAIEVWFNEIDEQGNRKRAFGYEFIPKKLEG